MGNLKQSETTQLKEQDGVKFFQSDTPLQAGDCIMIGPNDRQGPFHGPLVTIEANGSTSLRGWGRSTDDDDEWRIRILFLDINQVEIWSNPPAGQRMKHKMDHPGTWYLIENFFKIKDGIFDQIHYIRFEGEA